MSFQAPFRAPLRTVPADEQSPLSPTSGSISPSPPSSRAAVVNAGTFFETESYRMYFSFPGIQIPFFLLSEALLNTE